MRTRLRAVLYDWDGTLLDSAASSFLCYQHVFAAFGLRFEQADFERTYSPNWYRTYAAMRLPEALWSEADTLWLDHFSRHRSGLLPGVRAALDRVAGLALAQGLVSSGDGGRVRGELATHGLEAFFAAVVCGGDTEKRKPDPQPLLAALARLGVEPAAAAYVGDSPEDVEMTRAAGAFSVGIPGGFPNREALAAAEPHLLSPDLGAAIEALLELA